MTIWSPDTCDCILEYDENLRWKKTLLKCNLHRPLKRNRLLDEVLQYNRSFNLAFGRGNLTDDQVKLITLAKRVTKLKIRVNDFTGELPTQGTLTKLKNFLRLSRRSNL